MGRTHTDNIREEKARTQSSYHSPSQGPVHTNLAEKDQKIGSRSLWGQGSQVKGSSQPKASWLDGLLTWALEG